LLAITVSAFAINASAYSGEKLAGEAKISMDEARAIALKVHPVKLPMKS